MKAGSGGSPEGSAVKTHGDGGDQGISEKISFMATPACPCNFASLGRRQLDGVMRKH